MKIDPLTGMYVDPVYPIRKRLENITPGPWQQGFHWDADEWIPSSSGRKFRPVAQTDVDWIPSFRDARFIAHAPEDMAFLLERSDRVEALLEAKRVAVRKSYADSKWELSKGRVMSSLAYHDQAEQLERELKELEAAFYGKL